MQPVKAYSPPRLVLLGRLSDLTAENPYSISVSDRAVKGQVTPVEGREVLERLSQVPITTWNYLGQDGVRHLGPMAQDFRAAFDLGEDERHIHTVDAQGVALAAIQGLYQTVRERDAEIAALRARLARLERAVGSEQAAGR